MLICTEILVNSVSLNYVRVLHKYDYCISLTMFNTETGESFTTNPTFNLICNNDILGLIDNKYLCRVTKIEYQIYKCITSTKKTKASSNSYFKHINLANSFFRRYDYQPTSVGSLIFNGTRQWFNIMSLVYESLSKNTINPGIGFQDSSFELYCDNGTYVYELSSKFELLKTKLKVLERGS